MDNVGIVLEDIGTAIVFFTEVGLKLVGYGPIKGDWADSVEGLRKSFPDEPLRPRQT